MGGFSRYVSRSSKLKHRLGVIILVGSILVGSVVSTLNEIVNL